MPLASQGGPAASLPFSGAAFPASSLLHPGDGTSLPHTLPLSTLSRPAPGEPHKLSSFKRLREPEEAPQPSGCACATCCSQHTWPHYSAVALGQRHSCLGPACCMHASVQAGGQRSSSAG